MINPHGLSGGVNIHVRYCNIPLLHNGHMDNGYYIISCMTIAGTQWSCRRVGGGGGGGWVVVPPVKNQ